MKYPYVGRRVWATVIDYMIIILLSASSIYLVGDRQDNGAYVVTGWLAMAPQALWFVYFVIAERYLGGTFGHQLFKLKVVTMDGSGLFFGQVLVRRLCDALEIFCCCGLIAYLLVKSTANNQRLGDLLAKTRVVGVKDSYPYTNVHFDFERK
jgi:uncharacterized RDD family membrane protein YckC